MFREPLPNPTGTVHPHACGEHSASSSSKSPHNGSSPRLWGTSRSRACCRYPRRFIPTPVGNILISTWISAANAVHPHACGEHSARSRCDHLRAGSSPRLWGTWRIRGDRIFEERFIPTPVGNIAQTSRSDSITSVHPHACGEHWAISISTMIVFGSSPRLWGTSFNNNITLDDLGSSPRLWGTCKLRLPNATEIRFIPTPVGNIAILS